MGTVTFSTAVLSFGLPRVKVTVPSRRVKVTVPLDASPACLDAKSAMTDNATLSRSPRAVPAPASHAWHWWTHKTDAARLHRW